jgi:hypothetical protein
VMTSGKIPHMVLQLTGDYPGNHSNQGSLGIPHPVTSGCRNALALYVKWMLHIVVRGNRSHNSSLFIFLTLSTIHVLFWKMILLKKSYF